jgi:enoyl-CoA hydratase
MPSELLLVEKKGNTCTLALNRPEKRNSLSPDLLVDLYQTMNELAKDDTVRTLILRGSGEKAFSSGYDIGSIPTRINAEIQEKLKRQNPLELALNSVENYPYPVIAMLNGSAFGAGCELALCCDIRLAADDIRMGLPPAKLGLVYPWKGVQRFIQILGVRYTKEILFTGRTIEGRQLLEKGLVDYLVPRGELIDFTQQFAEEIANNAPLSLKGMKKTINLILRSAEMREEDRKVAESLMTQAFNSEDLKEGQRAFQEKRPPKFQGK